MGGSIGSDKIGGLAIGGDLVKGAAFGADLFFTSVPPFVQQRMNKSGNQSFSYYGGSDILLTGWTSDATYPSTIVSNVLIAQGAGTVTVSCSVNVSSNSSGTGASAYLRLNGVQIGSTMSWGILATGVKTATWTGAVANGDEISVWVNKSGAGSSATVSATNTWVNVQ
ncbi:hypothetical protein [Gordonia sp. (in: high G+C Gram-positive bacteria)]|uniref:hypothetical protein n=1 Tax=Gordonia sp. (in: high G+C Gram-positive bacteria) TaxID=84139 RepID=UPI0026106680|nr:hypothetical protein [Gordonia sp. (in: high G+C Gram-positive bacteria)]